MLGGDTAGVHSKPPEKGEGCVPKLPERWWNEVKI